MTAEQGDERFVALVHDVIEPVRRYLRRRTDPDTVEEVLSETLLVLWRGRDKTVQEPVAWAIGVARLQLANARRSEKRRHDLVRRFTELDLTVRHGHTGRSPTDDAVVEVLAGLRRDDAELLLLWIWEDLQPRHIAVVLNISAKTAQVRLHRARTRFAALAGKHPELAGHNLGENERRRP